jgi:GMP synthase-like glutamine amidotransferase
VRSPKLLIIDPSVAYPEDEGVAEVLGDWPGTSRISRPGLSPGDGPTPSDGYDVDGVVVMGSRASVYDEHPWIRELGLWLDPVLEGRVPIPVLGICFGHQLIAARRGASVGFLHPDRKEEIGLLETALDASHLVPDRARMRVVVSHKEEVKEVPAGYRVVASRPNVRIDGMEHERLPIFSYQFHPEARASFLADRGVSLDGLDAAAIADMNRLLASFRRKALDGSRKR